MSVSSESFIALIIPPFAEIKYDFERHRKFGWGQLLKNTQKKKTTNAESGI